MDGLTGSGEMARVAVYFLKLQCYTFSCTYGGGQQNKAKNDAVAAQVARS